jgi:tetratricopeptide (TPR) repeat protein
MSEPLTTTFRWIASLVFVGALVILAVLARENWRWLTATSNESAVGVNESADSVLTAKLARALDIASEAATRANDDKAMADKALTEKTEVARSKRADADSAKNDAVNGSNEKAANRATDAGLAATDAETQRDAAEVIAKQKADIATKANAARQALADLTSAPAQSGPAWRWTGFWLSLLMAGLFPLSAVAFGWLEVPFLLQQLKNDCYLLGKRDQQTQPYTIRWNQSSYALHYSLAVIATVLGVSLFLRQPDTLLDVNTLHAMQYGFLGAYVYCMNLVYRRYTTLDLQPHMYLYCALGLIAGMTFNFVAFAAMRNIVASNTLDDTAEFKGIGAGAAAILAFSLGYFPNLAIRWFARMSRTSVHERQRRSDALPLSLIDGISELHESRLQDEGIDNVQNLATASIPDLVVKTPFSAQEIVEWTDQAVLYLYLDPGEIESFRKAGVRSVSDFCDVWAGFSERYTLQADGTIKRIPLIIDSAAAKEFEDRRKAIAQQLATTEQRLDALFRATEQGPNMDYVRTYWNNVQTVAVQTRTLLINQVCGQIGRVIRESMREGDSLTPADILKQVANEMFLAAAGQVSGGAANATAESLYGQAYLKNQLGNTDEARRLYEQCIEKFPGDPVAYNDLAWLDIHTRSQKSALVRAREYALKAVDLARKSPPPLTELAPYLDTLAMAYIRLGDPAKAQETSKLAIEEWQKLGRPPEPRLLETLVDAAEVFVAQGDKTKATEVLDFVDTQKYASSGTKDKVAKVRQTLRP